MIYVLVDGKWHLQVEDAASLAASSGCGTPVPFGAVWTRDTPTNDLCPKCLPKKKAA